MIYYAFWLFEATASIWSLNSSKLTSSVIEFIYAKAKLRVELQTYVGYKQFT
jgi:hypothetical protein